MYLVDKWLKAERASEPDGIKWENLGVGRAERNCRWCFVQLICILIVIIGLYGMVKFKLYSDELTEQFDT